ncbi:hypothetical protein HYT56_01140 [Candidatus Woesearchaeota archaeon]|nr:hypothetical protein [Candidatus Woesearchaeota archaeon]
MEENRYDTNIARRTIGEIGRKILMQGGINTLEAICRDVISNAQLTLKRLDEIVGKYSVDEDNLWKFIGECSVLIQLNWKLEQLNTKGLISKSGSEKRRLKPNDREQIDGAFGNLQPGHYNSHQLSQYLKENGIEMSSRAVGSYIGRHKNREELGLRYSEKNHLWEKY